MTTLVLENIQIVNQSAIEFVDDLGQIYVAIMLKDHDNNQKKIVAITHN